MSSQPYITLYDTPSSTSSSWAPHIWRIRYFQKLYATIDANPVGIYRLILNYKRLPHCTVWVEFPEIDRKMRSIGAPPTSKGPDGKPVYTLPVIVDSIRNSNPIILSGPTIIAEYLEMAYPARLIFPEGTRALQTLFVQYIHDVVVRPLLPIMVPLSHQRLPERSQTHFFPPGQRPRDPIPPGAPRNQAWQAVRDSFDNLAAIMGKNGGDDGDGIVVCGRDLTYGDFALCAILIWIEKVSPQDGWLRVRSWNGGRWMILWERCKDYMDIY